MANMERVLEEMSKKGHVYDATPVDEKTWQNMLAENPEIPQDAQGLKDHIDMLHGDKKHPSLRGTPIARLFSLGLRSPNLSDDDVCAIDAYFHTATPPLPNSVESKNFHVRYDATGSYAVTKAVAQEVAKELDNHSIFYLGLFAKSPRKTSTTNGKQNVDIYDINGDGYVSYFGPLTLDYASMNNPHNLPWTTAHELFHCVEFAFGLDSPTHPPIHIDNAWFSEGAANWAATFANPHVVDGFWYDFTEYQTKSIFDQSYGAFSLWVYISGFISKSISHKGSGWAMKAFLDNYETSGKPIDALLEVIKLAAFGITLPAGIPALVARYTCAKATNEWAGAGSGYERKGTMPFMANPKNYNSFNSDPPPAIPFTDTENLSSANSSTSFGRVTLNQGCANLYKVKFLGNPPKGAWVHLTLNKRVSEPNLVACILCANGGKGLDQSPILHLGTTKPSSTTKFQLTNDNTDTLYIAVVDGHVGGTTYGNIQYTVKAEIKAT